MRIFFPHLLTIMFPLVACTATADEYTESDVYPGLIGDTGATGAETGVVSLLAAEPVDVLPVIAEAALVVPVGAPSEPESAYLELEQQLDDVVRSQDDLLLLLREIHPTEYDAAVERQQLITDER